jgi:hypothetical protein
MDMRLRDTGKEDEIALAPAMLGQHPDFAIIPRMLYLAVDRGTRHCRAWFLQATVAHEDFTEHTAEV